MIYMHYGMMVIMCTESEKDIQSDIKRTEMFIKI